MRRGAEQTKAQSADHFRPGNLRKTTAKGRGDSYAVKATGARRQKKTKGRTLASKSAFAAASAAADMGGATRASGRKRKPTEAANGDMWHHPTNKRT